MKTILHIESGKFFREVVKMIVEKRGFEIISTDNGNDALEILENNKISLIITGNELLDMRGEDLIRKINETVYSSIPVIILTSTESMSLRKRLFSLGIVDYILKKDMSKSRLENYFDNLMMQDLLLKKIQKEKTAVLDDDLTSLSVIKKIFKLNNIENADYFSDPADFLESASDYNFFLIDLVLPGLSGEEIIMEIKKRQKNSLILVVSGINNTKTISQSMMYGADDYITKPFDNSLLMLRLKANARTYFLYKELERQAVTDSLTGLYNHEYICRRVESLVDEYRGKEKKFCILMLDIDKFKEINDSCGHQTGDVILESFSKVIAEMFPDGICGRYGGDEFLVIIPDSDIAEGLRRAELFKEKTAASNFSRYNVSITFSGGLAEFCNESSEKLINKADQMLYKSKKSGRNSISAFSELQIESL